MRSARCSVRDGRRSIGVPGSDTCRPWLLPLSSELLPLQPGVEHKHRGYHRGGRSGIAQTADNQQYVDHITPARPHLDPDPSGWSRITAMQPSKPPPRARDSRHSEPQPTASLGASRRTRRGKSSPGGARATA
ncbi:hypothetical protein AAFF_G00019530 [Aldrovandia affinis]|uniref:Uncharacterized protein n=1 Tax=Aldrovandia affinis TaxID=143900 RepID=A0AAD7S5L3_9TELE|nr:hypothetical protein AAFF_G00019530 [Aldrovandia affinis]